MAHAPQITLTEADTKLPARMIAAGPKALIAGFALLAVGGLAAGFDLHRLGFAYLTAFAFWLTLALGGLVFLCLQHVSRAGWSVGVRRMIENVVSTIPWLFLASLPIVVPTAMGSDFFYHWNAEATIDFDRQHMPAKVPVYDKFLNNTFWTVRVLFYFTVWSLLARFFVGHSRSQDSDGDHTRTRKMEVLAAPGILLFALTLTFAGIDFLMSLEAHWFSTIFGVYIFAGCTMSSFCVIALLAMFFQEKGRLKDCVTVEHYHDLGKLTFAFVFFWGYIGFSQFMLIWYANIPEETVWFDWRFTSGWGWVSLILLFGHLLIPFLGLMARTVRRNKKFLFFASIYMLCMHWLDHYWLVMPQLKDDHSFAAIPLVQIPCAIGLIGLFVALFCFIARDKPLVPLKDPRLGEALNFENP